SYTSYSSPFFLSTLPSISLTRFNLCCSFLEYIFGQINSWSPASQVLLALTQTATNW
ncbi:unnamed protein product, partial [Hymenolepis diminuta]